jgi:hypothetical protein
VVSQELQGDAVSFHDPSGIPTEQTLQSGVVSDDDEPPPLEDVPQTSEENAYVSALCMMMATSAMDANDDGKIAAGPAAGFLLPINHGDDRAIMESIEETRVTRSTSSLLQHLRGRFWRNFAVYLISVKRVLTRLALNGPTDAFMMGKIRQGELRNVLLRSRMTFAEPRAADKNAGELFQGLVTPALASNVGAAFIECYVGYYSGAGWVTVVMADGRYLPSLGPLWGRCGPYAFACRKAPEYLGRDPVCIFGEPGDRNHYLVIDVSFANELDPLRPQVADDIFDGLMLFDHRWQEVMTNSQQWLAPLYSGVTDGVRNLRRAWHKLEEKWAGYNAWELELSRTRSTMAERLAWERDSGTMCVWYGEAYDAQLMEKDR